MLVDAGANGGQGVEGVARMTMRQELIEMLDELARDVLVRHHEIWTTARHGPELLDAVLEWLHTNAERIANTTAYPLFIEDIDALVAALREVSDEV